MYTGKQSFPIQMFISLLYHCKFLLRKWKNIETCDMTVNIYCYQIILKILNSLWNFYGKIKNFPPPPPLHVFIPYYLTCRYRISPDLQIASQDELKLWLLSFIQEHYLDKFGSYHSAADWAHIFRGLVSTLLIGANYNL